MIRRLTGGLAIIVAVLATSAAPAAAHGGPGGTDPPASNYRSRILEVEPSVDGLEMRVIEAGARLELSNRTGVEATILGYEGEPYLRVGSEGVYENVRSPATYLNQDRYAETPLPDDADADAEPEWRRVDGGTTARWHDHRGHWMGGEPPPAVDADREAEHVITPAWIVPIEMADGREVTVSGDLAWVPGPSPVPWMVAAAAAVLVIVVLGLRHRFPVVLVALVGLVVAAALDAVGVWQATSEAGITKAAGLFAPVVCALLGFAGLSQLRRSPDESMVLIGTSGAGFALLFGLANLDWLSRSQLPTGIEPAAARGSIAASLGLGVGLVVLAAVPVVKRLRYPNPAPTDSTAGVPARLSLEPSVAGRYRTQILVGVVGVLVVAAVVGTLFGEDDASPGAIAGAPLAHDQLCLAARLAADGDRAEAERIFFADVHRPLHDLAREAAIEDRRVASRLLRAKQAVESARASDPSALAEALARLVTAAQAAVETTTGNRPPDCLLEESS